MATETIKHSRRAVLGAIHAITLTGVATKAYAMPDADHDDLPDFWKEIVRRAEAVTKSGVPHAGAENRYTVVSKDKLDALQACIDGHGVQSKKDPHPAWFAEYVDADNRYNANAKNDGGDAMEKSLWEERERLCLLLAQTKASTVEGLAAQFAWFRHDLGYYIEENVGGEMSGILAVIEDGFGGLV